MSDDDRRRWDARHAEAGPAGLDDTGPPAAFAGHEAVFPTRGRALDVACGRGRAAVWLARRGLDVTGVDVSPVAVDLARRLADAAGVTDHCRFEVADLADGLPPGPPVDILLCHKYHDPALDRAMIERLAPSGLLAIAVLSEVGAEVGAGRGRFMAAPGELGTAFAELNAVAGGEGDGLAWLLATKPGSSGRRYRERP